MILGDLAGLGLFDALNLCEFTLANGVLHVRAGAKSGTVYIHDGRISFAEIDGLSAAPIDADRAGVPVGIWHEVVKDESLHGTVASALIDRGVDPTAVRRFVRQRIEHVVAELALEPEVELAAKPEKGWFGEEISYPISSVIEAARIINYGGELVGDHTVEALIAIAPTEQSTVVLGAEQWNVISELLGATALDSLRDRLGGRRATDFVRFLQSRDLATVVTGR